MVWITARRDAARDQATGAVRAALLADQVGIAVELRAAVIRPAALRGALRRVAAGGDALFADGQPELGAAVLARRRLAVLGDAGRRRFARPGRASLDVTALVDAGVEQAMSAPEATALAGTDGRVAVTGDAALLGFGGERRAAVGGQPRREAALLQPFGAVRAALFARGRLAVLVRAGGEAGARIRRARRGVAAVRDTVVVLIVGDQQAAVDALTGAVVVLGGGDAEAARSQHENGQCGPPKRSDRSRGLHLESSLLGHGGIRSRCAPSARATTLPRRSVVKRG
jgi:hypothetical protein